MSFELREAVLQDAMERIVGEHGQEILVLEWSILNRLTSSKLLTEDETTAEKRAKNNLKILSHCTPKLLKQIPVEQKAAICRAVHQQIGREKRSIKRNRKRRLLHKKRKWEPVDKPIELCTKLKEVSLGKDKNGYFVYTHRARCNSYPSPEEIPQAKIRFIGSTG